MPANPLRQLNREDLGELFLKIFRSRSIRAEAASFRADAMDYIGDVFEKVLAANPKRAVVNLDSWLFKTVRKQSRRTLMFEKNERPQQGERDE